MAGIYGPPWRIDGPPPEPRPYSLLTAARIVEDSDGGVERWGNGVEVYPYPSGLADAWDACAIPSEQQQKTVVGVDPTPEFGAMVVWMGVKCSTYGIFGAGLSKEQAQQRYVERAIRTFEAVESMAVEREFVAGDVLGLWPHLNDNVDTDFPNGDTLTSVVNGLAYLEDEIGKSGRGGMIHITPSVALVANGQTCVDRDDRFPRLRTINGTVVVPGAGYIDAPPPASHAAATGTQDWLYATGPVEVRRSRAEVIPGDVSQALSRSDNTITYRVERYYVVSWDTVVKAAVRVDRCQVTC